MLLPKVKLKSLPTFPSNIVGGTGIDATRINGHITLDYAWQEFGTISAIPTSPTSYLLTYDTATGVYVMVPSHLLGGGVAGIADAPINGTQYGRQSGAWTPIGASVANPTQTIGLTAVNGSSISAIRSDGAPALDTSISPDGVAGRPTWTGSHKFTNFINATFAVRTGTDATPNVLIQTSAEVIDAGAGFYINTAIVSNRVGGLGHREALHVDQSTSAASAGLQNVGIIGLGHASAGSGAIYGMNSYSWIDAACAASVECVSLEADTDCRRSPTVKVGIQIIDVSTSVYNGTTLDAGLVISKQTTAAGYVSAIQFGRDGQVGVLGGGTFIYCPASSTSYRAGIDFESVPNWSTAPIILPPNGKGVYWGSSKQGGAVVSETTSNAGDLNFGNAQTSFRFDGANTAVFSRKVGGGAGECFLNFFDGTNFFLRRVIVNGPDSGGAGFRSVKVEN